MSSRANLFPTYAPPQINLARGEGHWLIDENGRRYLDFIAGISVNTLGHAHPDLIKALTQQAEKLWHTSNMFQVPGQAELAARYCALSFADRAFFTNSGSESVECALKAARYYFHSTGQPQRTKVISFAGAFHGRTYAALNAAGNQAYLKGFGDPIPGYVQIPFIDIEALKEELDETAAAVIIEPVQGEGGVRVVPDATLVEIRKLCTEAGVLLIYDEVQCGAGRTGKLFAHQWCGDTAKPDIMATAKGVGGGFPLGICLATENVAHFMTPGTHGSTYGGNALAMAVGGAVLDYLEHPAFLSNICDQSEKLRAGLDELQGKHPELIADIRGKGLLLGLKLKIPNKDVKDLLISKGMLVGVAGDNVLRLAPALNLTAKEVNHALSVLEDAFDTIAASQTHDERQPV